MSVVEQAKSIIGRLSPRHRNARTGTHKRPNPRPEFDARTEAVGSTFERYYLEKIANLNSGEQGPK